MSDDKDFNWPTAVTAYLLFSAFCAILMNAILRRHSLIEEAHALRGIATVVVLVAVIVVVVVLYLRHKSDVFKNVIGWWLFGWVGAGLASYAIAEFPVVSGDHVVNPVVAAIVGPFAGFFCGGKFVIIILLVLYTVLVGEGINVLEIAKHDGGKTAPIKAVKKVRKVLGKDHAYKETPNEAHFVEVVEPIEDHVIEEKDLPNSIVFGTAQLAEDVDKTKRSVEIGIREEGSALVFGGTGAGKTFMLDRTILNIEAANALKGIRPTRIIVLSVKPRDIAGVVVRWLRKALGKVQIWDLTGKTVGTDTYGDQIQWAPILASTDYDKAKDMGKQVALSGQDVETTSDAAAYYNGMCVTLFACAFLAANLRGAAATYKDAFQWIRGVKNPKITEVESSLGTHIDRSDVRDALYDWNETRSQVLDKDPVTGGWIEKESGGEANITGNNLINNLTNLLTSVATEEAYKATSSPKFDPREWIRADDGKTGAALFLIGNMRNEGMTRSLLTPLIKKLIDEGLDYANEFEEERLPYDLIIYGDELANLAPVARIETVFSTVRSAGIRFIAIFQSFAQILKVYGANVASILMDNAAVIVVMAGMNNADFIRDLNTIAGSKEVEGGEGTPPLHSLIEGQHLTRLRKANSKTGKSGKAIAKVGGGVVELDMPLWITESRYDDRGEILPRYKEATEKLRAKTDPWGRRRRLAKKKAIGLHEAWTPKAKTWFAKQWPSKGGSESEVVSVTKPSAKASHAHTHKEKREVPCGQEFLEVDTNEILLCGQEELLCPDCEATVVFPEDSDTAQATQPVTK